MLSLQQCDKNLSLQNIVHVFQKKKEKFCQHYCTYLLTLHPQLFLQEIDPDRLFVALGECSTTVALKIKRIIQEFDKRRICEEVTLSRATGAPIIVWAARLQVPSAVQYCQVLSSSAKYCRVARIVKYCQALPHSFRHNHPVLTITTKFYKLLPSVINTAQYCPIQPPSVHFQWDLNVQWTELSCNAVTAVVRDIIVAVFQQELKKAA